MKIKPNYRLISKKIKAYRKDNGLSHKSFAEKSHIGSSRTISRYEKKINDMKLSTFYKIAHGLGVHPKELL